jgi:carbon storage regulator CsrA
MRPDRCGENALGARRTETPNPEKVSWPILTVPTSGKTQGICGLAIRFTEGIMLVLSRGLKEEVVIGKAGQVLSGPIIVSIEAFRLGKVQLGFHCDREIPVHRKEVQERIDEECDDRNSGRNSDL